MNVTQDGTASTTASTAVTAGAVETIHVAAVGGGPMLPVDRVRAIAGVGLEGDRYAVGTGHYSGDMKVDRQVTLIAAEELDRLADLFGIDLAPGMSRRNVTTRGIDVNRLLGRRFRIGGVECEGTRLCEPCTYLEGLLGERVLEPLVHRAGLRARILSGGEIAVGDAVVAID